MLCVRIATGLWTTSVEMKLIEAVQATPVSAFQIPEADCDIVLNPPRGMVAL